MTELKPCPFCGARAGVDNSWPHHVFCVECGAKVTSLLYAEEGDAEAAEKWNRRAEDDRLQLIADIAIDYDGYHTADDLKELIDELRDIALNGVPKKEGADND